MSESDNNQKKKYLGWGITAVVLIVVIMVVCLLFSSEESYISETVKYEKTVAIECENENPAEAFFVNESATEVEHTIKGVFTGEILTKISYNYEGNFASNSVAETAEAVFHAQYNKYMAEKGLNPDSLKPVFSNSGDDVKITLITDANKLSSGNVQFFFLNMDDFQHVKSYTSKDLANIYRGKGFSCEIHE